MPNCCVMLTEQTFKLDSVIYSLVYLATCNLWCEPNVQMCRVRRKLDGVKKFAAFEMFATTSSRSIS